MFVIRRCYGKLVESIAINHEVAKNHFRTNLQTFEVFSQSFTKPGTQITRNQIGRLKLPRGIQSGNKWHHLQDASPPEHWGCSISGGQHYTTRLWWLITPRHEYAWGGLSYVFWILNSPGRALFFRHRSWRCRGCAVLNLLLYVWQRNCVQ